MGNIIIQEIKARINDQDTLFAIVGPEIKIRRISLNKTLKFMAYHVCSISYVSKLESNSIKPNRYFLNEIGKKVNMSEEDIDGLFDLRDILNQGLKEFLFNNNSTIKQILDENTSYVNYRYRLLLLLNSLIINDLVASKKTYSELLKISNSMTNYDFKIFVLLASIFLYKIGNIKEAYEDLKMLSKLELSEDIKVILDLYMFYCLNVLGKPETFVYYQRSKENLAYVGAYELLDELNYYFALYYIKNGSCDYSLTLINTIRDIKRKRTIELLSMYLSNNPINHFKKKELLAPARCLYDYLFDKASLDKDIKSFTNEVFQLDFNPILFNYLLLEDDYIEKYSYITNEVCHKLKRCDDLFIKKFYMKEIYSLSEKTAKYKALFDVYKIYLKEEYI